MSAQGEEALKSMLRRALSEQDRLAAALEKAEERYDSLRNDADLLERNAMQDRQRAERAEAELARGFLADKTTKSPA